MKNNPIGTLLLMMGAIAALLSSVAFIYMHNLNGTLAETQNNRQKLIDDGVRLSRFNAEFVKLLAQVSVQSGDEAFKDLLARHGITYTYQPAETAAEETGND